LIGYNRKVITRPILTSTLNNSSNDSREKKIELSYKTNRIVTLIAQDLFHDFNEKKTETVV